MTAKPRDEPAGRPGSDPRRRSPRPGPGRRHGGVRRARQPGRQARRRVSRRRSQWSSASTWSRPGRRSRSSCARCRGAGSVRGAVAAARLLLLTAAAAGLGTALFGAVARGAVAGAAVAVRILAVAVPGRGAARDHRPDRPRRRPRAGARTCRTGSCSRRSPRPGSPACSRRSGRCSGSPGGRAASATTARSAGSGTRCGAGVRAAGGRGPARHGPGDGDGGPRFRRGPAPDVGAADPAARPGRRRPRLRPVRGGRGDAVGVRAGTWHLFTG